MIYLFIALVFALLLVLYLVALKVKPFGKGIAFVCTVIARVLVKIEEYLSLASDYFHKVVVASLRYPPGVSESDYWSGVNVIARLVIFLLAVTVLVAEPVNTLLVLPSLFQTTSNIHLPGIVELTSAAQFITSPALWGCAFFECCGLIPRGCGMFPHMTTLTRWVLGILSGMFLLLAILVTGYLYLFRAVYLLSPEATLGMSLYILGGLGLLTAASAPLALWACVPGGAGVVSLLLWVAEQVCKIVAALASFVPQVLDVVAIHFGGISVYQTFCKPADVPVPSVQFDPSEQETTAKQQALLPEHMSTKQTGDVEIVPILTPEMEEKNMNPDKNASLIFGGSFGTKMIFPVSQKIATLRATESILTSYSLDLTNTHMQTCIAGIRDLSHVHSEKKAAMLHGESENEACRTLLKEAADRLVEAHLDLRAVPAPFLYFLDCHQLVNAVDMFESVKRRVPLSRQLVITSVSALDLQNKVVQTGLAAMMRLYAEDILETVLVVDPRSPFAACYGEETQLHFLSQALVSLLIAHKHSVANSPFTNVLQEWHSLSPFMTVSFASQQVAVGQTPKKWAWMPGVSGNAGTGNYGDLLTQAREGTDRVVTEENTRSFPAQMGTDTASTLLLNIPISISDVRFSACVRDNALYVSSHYPFATSITVRGNGSSYPHHVGGRYLVQASHFYAVQPTNFPKFQPDKSVKVTPLYPVTPTSVALAAGASNGDLHTNETPNTPTKKAVPASSSKPTPSGRGGRRKSTEK